MSAISRSFPSLTQLELNLEINIANPSEGLLPAVTLNNALDLWRHLWNKIKQCRNSNAQLVPCPQLCSLDVVAGSFRKAREATIDQDRRQWERRESQIFEVRRSQHDNAAEAGLADVKCVQVEKLLHGLGTGPVEELVQTRLLEETQLRASAGVLAERDTRMRRDRPQTPTRAHNSFETHLAFDTVVPQFSAEDHWFSLIS